MQAVLSWNKEIIALDGFIFSDIDEENGIASSGAAENISAATAWPEKNGIAGI